MAENLERPDVPIDRDHIPEWLYWVNQAKGVTYEAICNEVGLSKGMVNRYIHKNEPPEQREHVEGLLALIERYAHEQTFKDELKQPYHYLAIADAALQQGRYLNALTYYQSALEARPSQRYRDYTYMRMARCQISLQRLDDAEASLTEIVNSDDLYGLEKRVTWAGLAYARGEWDRAWDLLDETRGELERSQDDNKGYELLDVLMRMIGIRYYQGEWAEASEYIWRALGIARRLGSTQKIATIYHLWAECAVEQGDWRDAATALERGIDVAEQDSRSHILTHLYAARGRYEMRMGNHREALNWLFAADEIAERESLGDPRVHIMALRSEVWRRRAQDTGDLPAILDTTSPERSPGAEATVIPSEQAALWADRAVELAESFESLRLADALMQKGRILGETAPDEARRLLERARTVARGKRQTYKVKTCDRLLREL